MRLLFVSHESQVNGSTKSMATLINSLKKLHNCKIDVLIPGEGAAERFLEENKIRYRVMKYCSNFRKIGTNNKMKNYAREIINDIQMVKLMRIVRKNEYDYIISNSSAVDIAARVAYILKVKHIFYIREFMEEDFSFEYINKNRMKQLIENADKVIFISNAIKEKYCNKYEIKNYRVIYNAIESKEYYQEEHKILYDNCLKFIQIGSLSDGKGTLDTLRYINHLRKIVPCHITFVGNVQEQYFNKLDKYVTVNEMKEMVQFIPYTREIKKILNSKDILIMNSHMEGFGRVTVEGMLNGLLVLGKETGGTTEIIKDNYNGLLFRDENDFIEKIIRVVENKDYYRKIALQGQDEAAERFSPKKNADDVWSYLNEISV